MPTFQNPTAKTQPPKPNRQRAEAEALLQSLSEKERRAVLKALEKKRKPSIEIAARALQRLYGDDDARSADNVDALG